MLERRELLASFTVTSSGDDGDNASPTPGSLRAAILAVNSGTSAVDSIGFDIPGGGVRTISLKAALPAITRTVVIDGTTQPGYSATTRTPVIAIDGAGAGSGSDGLILEAGGGVIRGLSIVNFVASPSGAGGSAILLSGPGGDRVEGNFLGIGPDGTPSVQQEIGVNVVSPGNVIGGATLADRNVISGNGLAGIFISGSTATGNLASNNLIGTDPTGTRPAGNAVGVLVAAPDNTIGGPTAATGNLISGNTGPQGKTGIGILLRGQATGVLVEGNRIGTDIGGGAALANVYGVYFGTPGGSTSDVISQDTIGGTAQGAGNLISGNFVGITGNATAGSIVGNTIGLDAAGTSAIPNGDGILLGASGTTIGGPTAGARNVIAASGGPGTGGVNLTLTGDSDLIEGNYVGTDAAGNRLVGPGGGGGNGGLKLHVTKSTIGGSTQGAGNVIFGGIALDNNGGDLIQGNRIGVGADGRTILGSNPGSGIDLTILPTSPVATQPLALNDTIGGTAAGAGNIIAGNDSGITVRSTYGPAVTGITIRGNSIFANPKLGIDLTGTGQPLPGYLFLTASSVSGGMETITGVFHGLPGATYGIDLFGNYAGAGVSPTGFGQGQAYLGSTSVTTDSAGFAAFNPSVPAPSTPFDALSATSTGPDGNTSEFAANFPRAANADQADLSVTSTASAASVVAGDRVMLIETIANNGPDAASGVTLTDTLPIGLVNTSVTSDLGTASVDGNNVVTANLSSLAPGRSYRVTITGTAARQGTLVDNPGVASTTSDPNFANNESQRSIPVTPAPGTSADLAISQVASTASAVVGSNLTYTITVTNNGPNAATNVTVNEFLSSGVALVRFTPSQGAAPVQNGTLLSANLGTIAPGAAATITLVVTPTAAGPTVNAANVSGGQFDATASNNSTSLTTAVGTSTAPNINLQLSESVSPSASTVGQLQLFILTVTNKGTDPATHATIIDMLPVGAVFVLAGSPGAVPASDVNGVLTYDLGTIAPGGSATFDVVVISTMPGVLINFAGVYTPDVPTAAPSFAFGAVAVTVPIPGPSVVGIAGTGNNGRLDLTFDEALNPATATNRANYRLTSLGRNGRGPSRNVPIALATYNPGAITVVLFPARAIDPKQTYRIVAIGSTPSGIADTRGRRLLNAPGGTPGRNFSATFVAGKLPQI